MSAHVRKVSEGIKGIHEQIGMSKIWLYTQDRQKISHIQL